MLTITPPIVVMLIMSFEVPKMLGWYIRLGPPKFSSASGEDAHEFLIRCPERLHNIKLVESHRVDYTTFHIVGQTK